MFCIIVPISQNNVTFLKNMYESEFANLLSIGKIYAMYEAFSYHIHME